MPVITLLHKKNKVKCASYQILALQIFFSYEIKKKQANISLYVKCINITILQNTSFTCLMLIMKYQACSANFPVPAPTALHVFSFI